MLVLKLLKIYNNKLEINYLSHGGSDRVKNLPAMQETWVRSLGPEDFLEKTLLISLATGGIQTSRIQLEFNVWVTRHHSLNPKCQALQGTAERWKPSALPSGPWGNELRAASNQEPVRT